MPRPLSHTPRAASLEPGASPGFLLWRVTLRWQRTIVAALRPLGLTHVQFVLLASVWWLTRVAGESPTQRRLAEHAAIDPMMTSQVLRVLERKHLIARSADPEDSRAWRVSVTTRGATLAGQAIAVVEAADAAFFSAAGDQSALVKMLSALAADGGPSRSR